MDILQSCLRCSFPQHSSPYHTRLAGMFVPGLSEVEAICIIDFILFGRVSAQPTRAPLARKRNNICRKPRTPSHDKYSASNDDFFATIVLRKRPVMARRPAPPTTPIFKQRPLATAGSEDVKFPTGLCYLVSVALSLRGAAMLVLGSYPTVNSLLANWVFDPSCVFLTPQRDGLYHATSSPTVRSVHITSGHGLWQVGADNSFPSLPPQNPLSGMGPPLPPPHSPRASNNSAQPARLSRFDQRYPLSRGLPDRGAHRGRGRGRGMDPSPFQVQYTDD